MEWSTIIQSSLPLLGVAVGGVITWLTTSHAENKRAEATLKAEERAAKLRAIERRRERVETLHERVLHDFADFRQEFISSAAEVNLRAAELLDDMLSTVRERHDRVGVLIAVVDGQSVRDRADAVYELWGGFTANQSAELASERQPYDVVKIEELFQSSSSFTEVVREVLTHLNDEEAKLFKK